MMKSRRSKNCILIAILFSTPVSATEELEVLSEAKETARHWLNSIGYQKSEFLIEPICTNTNCEVSIYPKGYKGSYRGCPGKVCATLSYDFKLKEITSVVYTR